MDKFLAGLILLLIVIFGAIGFLCVTEFKEREEAPLIPLSEIVENKAEYKGKYIKTSGILGECTSFDTSTWFMVIFVPIDSGDSVILMPIFIPVTDEYRVYELSEGDYKIAILIKDRNLDKDFGKRVTICGEVDGVKDSNEKLLDYVIKVQILEIEE